jgi:hypothetical protein
VAVGVVGRARVNIEGNSSDFVVGGQVVLSGTAGAVRPDDASGLVSVGTVVAVDPDRGVEILIASQADTVAGASLASAPSAASQAPPRGAQERAGFAVMYAGDTVVHIVYAPIEGDPIVQVRPYGAVPKNAYWVTGVTASSFDLHIAEVLKADIRFVWTVQPGDQVPEPASSEGDSSVTEDVVEPVTSTASVSSSELEP